MGRRNKSEESGKSLASNGKSEVPQKPTGPIITELDEVKLLRIQKLLAEADTIRTKKELLETKKRLADYQHSAAELELAGAEEANNKARNEFLRKLGIDPSADTRLQHGKLVTQRTNG